MEERGRGVEERGRGAEERGSRVEERGRRVEGGRAGGRREEREKMAQGYSH